MPRRRSSTRRSVSAEPARSAPPTRPRNGQLWYNGDEADRVVRWFRERLVHTEGLWAGRPFVLTDWQEFDIVRPLFGWMRWDSQWRLWVRRYSKGQIWLPRGNGKSELAAGVELFLLDGDGEEGAEVYSAAEDRDQASIVYRVAAQMVRLSPYLSAKRGLTPIDSTKRIISRRSNSFLVALPRDEMGSGAQGFKVHGAVVDELHTQKRRELLTALKKGMGKRAQGLFLTISTAGNDPASPEAEDYAYAKRVFEGAIVDNSLFVYIREAPEDADPFDEDVWYDANPALGDFLSIQTLREEAHEARGKPSEMNGFLQFRLNRHVSQVTRYIPMEAWDGRVKGSEGNIQLASDLRGRLGYGGLDSAAEQGLIAFELLIPDDEEPPTYDLVSRFWLPRDDIEAREIRDRSPYREWARDGTLTLTEGNVRDVATIAQDIVELATRYEVTEIGYRRTGALELAIALADEGLTMVPLASTATALNDATTALLELIVSGRLRHGGNAALRWEADGFSVKADSDRNIKPDQSHSSVAIPGMLALIRALDRAIRTEDSASYLFMEASGDADDSA